MKTTTTTAASEPKASATSEQGAKPRKRYDEEFKIQAIRLLDQGQRTQRALAAELGISEVTLGQWKQRYGVPVAQARLVGPVGPTKQSRSAGHPVATAMELARLQRDLDHMTRQRDILKKALSICTQGPLSALK
jgi:transposase